MESTAGVANTLEEQVDIQQVGEDEYISTKFPGRMGNTKPIAYGGCTTAVAVHSACRTVKAGFHLYSVLGYFLGPALTDRPVRCRVYRSRDTKTFATRRAVLMQTLPNGSERRCLEIIADFQANEPSSVMEYSPRPAAQYQSYSQALDLGRVRDQAVAEGKISKKVGAGLDEMFALMGRFWETRACVEGVNGQNVAGLGQHLPTDQDGRHISDKYSASWMRAKEPLPTQAEQLAALAFNMDGGLSFLPLVHDHKFLQDVGACSSLDFALRIFSNNLDMTKWHLKETKTIAAGNGRTFSEARLFDENGNLVAIESQQSIMRPLPTKARI